MLARMASSLPSRFLGGLERLAGRRGAAPGGPPGPPRIPLLGNKGGLIRFFRDPVGNLLRLHAAHGDVAALSSGDPTLVCAFGMENNRRVLSDAEHFHNSASMPFPVPKGSSPERLFNALMAMNGEQHRRHRRLMMPAFGKAAVAQHRDDMVATVERLVERIRPGDVVDVNAQMIELTMIAAMRCLFGVDLGSGAEELGRMSMAVAGGITDFRNLLFPHDLPGTPYARFMRLCERMERRVRALILERRAAKDRPRDVLSILIEAHDDDGVGLTDDELVGHVNVLFIAGHETTAFTLTWTLFLLAQHPRVYADLEAELRSALRGDAPTAESLSRLPLLDAVVRESMRLLPPTPFLFVRRGASAFSLGPHALPAGAKVILSPIVTHRAASLYPEPKRFLPGRWDTISPGPYEYMPFGAGPRFCIGAAFGAQLVRIALAVLVQRFRFTLPPDARIARKVQGITMGPRYGMPMRVARHDGQLSPSSNVQGDIHELVDLR